MVVGPTAVCSIDLPGAEAEAGVVVTGFSATAGVAAGAGAGAGASSATAIAGATYLLRGSSDVATAELSMLEAVLLAEAKDRANWELLGELAQLMAEGEVRDQLESAAAEVLAQEEQHHTWAVATRAGLLVGMVAGEPPGTGDVIDLRERDHSDATHSDTNEGAR